MTCTFAACLDGAEKEATYFCVCWYYPNVMIRYPGNDFDLQVENEYQLPYTPFSFIDSHYWHRACLGYNLSWQEEET
jgi:hypothetical protein